MFDEKNHDFHEPWYDPDSPTFDDERPRDHSIPHSFNPQNYPFHEREHYEHHHHVPLDPAFVVPPIPPMRPPIGYTTPEEQVRALTGKMNQLIDTLNGYNKRVYGAYDAIVNSAIYNDAYYKEITIEDGYISETSSPYKVIHIPFLDRAKRPIYLELGLAYNNTTNSGVKEDVFSCSKRTISDKLIPATNVESGLYGVGTWKYAPIIESDVMPIDMEDNRKVKWSMGVTTNGFIKAYPENDNTREQMNRDGVRNSMGILSVLIKEGKASSDLYGDEEITARVGIGMNYHTKERFIVIVDDSPVPAQGCTCEQLGNIFQNYHCNVAVEIANKTNVCALDKGEFIFYPESADSPVVPSVPAVSAFWYITKRRHYHNEYVKEVAELFQTVNENEWRARTANFTVDYLKTEVNTLSDNLKKVERESKDRDQQNYMKLDSKIDSEVVTLNERIDSEVEALEEADRELTQKLTAETTAREQGDTKLTTDLNTEITERKSKDTELDNADIDRVKQVEDTSHVVSFTLVRKDASVVKHVIKAYEPEELKKHIIKEVKRTQDGTKDTYTLMNVKDEPIDWFIDLYNYDKLVSKLSTLDAKDSDNEAAILQEAQTRATEDTRLSGRIDGNDSSISDLTERVDNLEGKAGETTTKNAEQDEAIKALQDTYSQLESDVTQKLAEVDSTVAGMQATVASTESSQEKVKQAMNELQQEMNTFEERVDSKVQTLEDKVTALEQKQNEDAESLSTQLQGVAQNAQSAKELAQANSDRITFVQNNITKQMENADKALEQKIEDNRNKLQDIVDILAQNLQSLTQTVETQTTNIETLTNTVNSQTTELTMLSETVESQRAELDNLKEQINSGNIPELKDRLDKAEQKFSEYLPLSGGTMTGSIQWNREVE